MKWLWIVVAVLLVALVIGAIYVRNVSHDPDRWHIDPASVKQVEERNQYLGRAVFEGPVPLGDLLTRILSDDPNVRILAGDLKEGWATYVVVSPLVGFPDYVSVRIDEIDIAQNPRARIAVFSRSRFGYSDLGANKARVEEWIAALKAAVE